MKEILSTTFRIMWIYILISVIVSVIALFADTKPTKKEKAQFVGFGKGEVMELATHEMKDTEGTDNRDAAQNEDGKAAFPFKFDVNIITETKQDEPPQNVHHVHQIIPNNSMAVALEELERWKKYFICFCKWRFRRKFNKTALPRLGT